MANSICSVEGCDGKHYGRGWCSKHYQLWWRTGSIVTTHTEEGAPMRFLQEVAAKYEGADCLIWPYGRSGEGRAQVWADGKVKRACRVLCEMVHGAPPAADWESAHSCGNGHLACVNPKHLSWKTRAGNEADKLIHDTHNRGARNGQSKLTDDKVRAIRGLAGVSPKSHIAKQFGVSRSTVQLIHKGARWGHLTD